MPKREPSTETIAYKPLIAFHKVAFQKESFRLSSDLVALIRDYTQYVSANTGAEPTADEVVQKGMQHLFDADKGFRQWRQKRARSEQKPQTENNTTSAETALVHSA